MNQAATSPRLRHCGSISIAIRTYDVTSDDDWPRPRGYDARAQGSFFFLDSLRRPQQSALLTNSQIRYAGPQQHLPR